MQSVPITTKVVSSNLVHGEVYSIQHNVIKFVSDLRQFVLIYLHWDREQKHHLCYFQEVQNVLHLCWCTYLWIMDKSTTSVTSRRHYTCCNVFQCFYYSLKYMQNRLTFYIVINTVHLSYVSGDSMMETCLLNTINGVTFSVGVAFYQGAVLIVQHFIKEINHYFLL